MTGDVNAQLGGQMFAFIRFSKEHIEGEGRHLNKLYFDILLYVSTVLVLQICLQYY